MHPYEPNNGDFVVNPAFPANGTPGEIISVRTRMGRRIQAWRPTAPLPANPNAHYFCHGFSLGTAAQFGYTVVSGTSVTTVLADEYLLVGTFNGNNAPAGILPQDVLVWWQGMEAVHSARVVNAVYAGAQLNDALTTVNSKTGTGILRQGVALSVVKNDYRTATRLEAYRRAPGG